MTVVPVLLYHSVSDDPLPEIAEYNLTRQRFADHVRVIRDSGRTPITFADWVGRMRAAAADPANGISSPERVVVVTFDDGYDNNLSACALLAEHGIPSTVYVTTDYVGRSGFVDEAGLRDLAAIDGVTVGSHAVSHRRLDELPASELGDEVRLSRTRLADVLGRPCETFAYPHGNHGARVRRAVQDAGYASAAGVKNAYSHEQDDVYGVARLMATRDWSADQLERFLGNDRPLAPRREKLQTKGYRAYRRVRKRLTEVTS
jgi:peptidoglycan/xylan/chitin deacetylase (PgdA/CDA1 family)